MSLLGKLGIGAVLVILALIFTSLLLFNLDKELLSMGSDLGAGSGLDEVLYFFPVFSIEFETIEELLMLFLGPSACSS